jgi:Spy/CpxP family protein refolding chaperone
MKLNTKIVAGAVAALALTAAGLSLAHPGGGYGMGYGMGPGYGMHGGMGYGMGPGTGMGPGAGMGPGMGYGMGPGMGAAGPEGEAALAGSLAALKTELKITPAQETAWTTYEKQTRQQAESMQAMHQQMQEQMHGQQAAGKTPADFEALRAAMFKLRQANAEARAVVVKDLYAVLTTEQKAVADRRLGGRAFGPGQGRGYGAGPGYGWAMRGGCPAN